MACFIEVADAGVPIVPVRQQSYQKFLAEQPEAVQNWLNDSRFTAKPGQFCLLPHLSGKLEQVIVGFDPNDCFMSVGDLPRLLPAKDYYFTGDLQVNSLAYLAWGLGAYRFTKYKKNETSTPNLVLPNDPERHELSALLEGIYLVRDLINLPAEAMGPAELALQAKELAELHGASYQEIVGDALLTENLPAIHVVGRASPREPRLIELTWGDPQHPQLALVGKGICFDTGGLDLKPPSAMELMKKDMGGAAHVLGLAHVIMKTQLPVYLHVFIPAADNAVSGNAFRPGDVIATRKGLSIEIGNTDAEGRLVLADALTKACEGKPDLLIDFATLTGAARSAVGTEIAAYFCNDPKLSRALKASAKLTRDPIWQLPLHKPYQRLFESKIADLNNSGNDRYAGAIIAALFLNFFITPETSWAHFDVMAYNVSPRPGHPEGGEAMGLQAVYAYLKQWLVGGDAEVSNKPRKRRLRG